MQVKRWGLHTRCTFQKSTKWGIKISPNTLSFKKLFPAELIGNLQRITLLVCPTQIFRQTKEDSLDQCATLHGKFNRVVDALDTTDMGECAVHAQLFAEWGSAQYLNVFIFTVNLCFRCIVRRVGHVSATRLAMMSHWHQCRVWHWWRLRLTAVLYSPFWNKFVTRCQNRSLALLQTSDSGSLICIFVLELLICFA